MSVEINLAESKITVSYELPPTVGDNQTNQKIEACIDGINKLFVARKTALPNDFDLTTINQSIVNLYNQIGEALHVKIADPQTALAAIEESLSQLKATVEVLGSAQATEQAINDEAAAKKSAIDAETSRKLAAIAIVVK